MDICNLAMPSCHVYQARQIKIHDPGQFTVKTAFESTLIEYQHNFESDQRDWFNVLTQMINQDVKRILSETLNDLKPFQWYIGFEGYFREADSSSENRNGGRYVQTRPLESFYSWDVDKCMLEVLDELLIAVDRIEYNSGLRLDHLTTLDLKFLKMDCSCDMDSDSDSEI